LFPSNNLHMEIYLKSPLITAVFPGIQNTSIHVHNEDILKQKVSSLVKDLPAAIQEDSEAVKSLIETEAIEIFLTAVENQSVTVSDDLIEKFLVIWKNFNEDPLNLEDLKIEAKQAMVVSLMKSWTSETKLSPGLIARCVEHLPETVKFTDLEKIRCFYSVVALFLFKMTLGNIEKSAFHAVKDAISDLELKIEANLVSPAFGILSRNLAGRAMIWIGKSAAIPEEAAKVAWNFVERFAGNIDFVSVQYALSAIPDFLEICISSQYSVDTWKILVSAYLEIFPLHLGSTLRVLSYIQNAELLSALMEKYAVSQLLIPSDILPDNFWAYRGINTVVSDDFYLMDLILGLLDLPKVKISQYIIHQGSLCVKRDGNLLAISMDPKFKIDHDFVCMLLSGILSKIGENLETLNSAQIELAKGCLMFLTKFPIQFGINDLELIVKSLSPYFPVYKFVKKYSTQERLFTMAMQLSDLHSLTEYVKHVEETDLSSLDVSAACSLVANHKSINQNIIDIAYFLFMKTSESKNIKEMSGKRSEIAKVLNETRILQKCMQFVTNSKKTKDLDNSLKLIAELSPDLIDKEIIDIGIRIKSFGFLGILIKRNWVHGELIQRISDIAKYRLENQLELSQDEIEFFTQYFTQKRCDHEKFLLLRPDLDGPLIARLSKGDPLIGKDDWKISIYPLEGILSYLAQPQIKLRLEEIGRMKFTWKLLVAVNKGSKGVLGRIEAFQSLVIKMKKEKLKFPGNFSKEFLLPEDFSVLGSVSSTLEISRYFQVLSELSLPCPDSLSFSAFVSSIKDQQILREVCNFAVNGGIISDFSPLSSLPFDFLIQVPLAMGLVEYSEDLVNKILTWKSKKFPDETLSVCLDRLFDYFEKTPRFLMHRESLELLHRFLQKNLVFEAGNVSFGCGLRLLLRYSDKHLVYGAAKELDRVICSASSVLELELGYLSSRVLRMHGLGFNVGPLLSFLGAEEHGEMQAFYPKTFCEKISADLEIHEFDDNYTPANNPSVFVQISQYLLNMICQEFLNGPHLIKTNDTFFTAMEIARKSKNYLLKISTESDSLVTVESGKVVLNMKHYVESEDRRKSGSLVPKEVTDALSLFDAAPKKTGNWIIGNEIDVGKENNTLSIPEMVNLESFKEEFSKLTSLALVRAFEFARDEIEKRSLIDFLLSVKSDKILNGRDEAVIEEILDRISVNGYDNYEYPGLPIENPWNISSMDETEIIQWF
jgi:hypothetical protein